MPPLRSLLIVPYGIETQCTRLRMQTDLLLIVPYGIETTCNYTKGRGKDHTSNRTLWN